MNLRKERKEAYAMNSAGLDVAKDSDPAAFQQRAKRKRTGKEDCEDSETLSDIDDADVDGYLHNKEETRLKTMIWEKLNKEYLHEQVFKDAIAAAEKRARGSSLSSNSCPEDVQQAAVADLKAMKEKTRRKAIPKRPTAPSRSSVAGASDTQMLSKKRLSSKINYDVLDKLFGDPVFEDGSKRSRIETTGYEGNDESKEEEDAVEEKDEDEDIAVGGMGYEEEDFDEENEDYDNDYDDFQ